MDLAQAEPLRLISELCDSFTDEYVEAAGVKRLKQIASDEKVFGRIHSLTTRRLFLAYITFGARRERCVADGKVAVTDDEIKRIQTDALKADALEDLAKEWFWSQAKFELDCWEEGECGVRAGWQVVIKPVKPNSIEALLGRITGG
jgi:hypothetical protein